ncbi:MAG: hypothetical protein JOZ36_11030 [Acidobacteria bacterium]|nr:hypothetical protein [Acidobacteriota bacterium]
MIRFDGDWCRRTKAADENWILGVAAEAVGITAARRKITIMPRWMRDAAVHPLAVHFCCGECKDDYMAQLFTSRPLMKNRCCDRNQAAHKAPRSRTRKSHASGSKARVHPSKRVA